MQIKVFMVPAKGSNIAEADLNGFLRSRRVLTVKRDLISDGENSFWTFCVEYLEAAGADGAGMGKLAKVDYREVLKPEEFAVFSRLRDWRRTVAEAKGVPVYTVLTNEQMAQMVQRRITSKDGLKEVEGVGEARVREYGDDVMQILLQRNAAQTESTPVNPAAKNPEQGGA